MADLERGRRVPPRTEDVRVPRSPTVPALRRAIAPRFAVLLAAVVMTVPPYVAQAQGTAAAVPTATSALLDSLRPGIERALAAADWSTLDRATARLRAAISTAVGKSDAWLHYDLAYALHRRASAMIVEDRTKEARTLLEESQRTAARARELGASTHALALEGAVTGQLAGVSGAFAAMRFGPRSFKLLDEAVETAPQDPRVALLNGISRLNAPRAFGGGAAKGEPELRRALQLYADDRNVSPLPVWGRADAHLWLGIALDQQGKTAEARAEFQRALALAPGHRWITDELLPGLDRKR
jgi:tetratricopeptide (TPR) repeat protein